MKENIITKTVIFVNAERLTFDTSIKEVLKKTQSAFVQILKDEETSEDLARAIRANLSDHTNAGKNPVNVVISGFSYDPEIIESIERLNCKLIWAC